MLTGEFSSVLVFFLALVPWVGYLLIGTFFIASIWYSRYRLYKETPVSNHLREYPGVSIIKPLMGVDAFLEQNLESHFTLQYSKFELLFCVHTACDPAIEIVQRLQKKYPTIDTRLFIDFRHKNSVTHATYELGLALQDLRLNFLRCLNTGDLTILYRGGKNGILNPMVNNMAPAYEAAKYNVIWVSSSRVQVSTAMLVDMVAKLQDPEVALVHQMPFVSDQPGLSAAVEKVYFGCTQARFYLAFHVLGITCFTGMSYLVKKEELDGVNGLPYYGRYLAEDFFFSKSLRQKGRKHIVSAYPALQRVENTSFSAHRDRMIRWSRLRINMLPLVSGILEPLGECLPLGLLMALSQYHLFGLSPFGWLVGHILVWCTLDFVQLTAVQGGALPFSIVYFVFAWLLREVLSIVYYFLALRHVRYIRWGRGLFRLSNFGKDLQLVKKDTELQDV